MLLLQLTLLNVEVLGLFDAHFLQLLALTGQQESFLFLELASFCQHLSFNVGLQTSDHLVRNRHGGSGLREGISRSLSTLLDNLVETVLTFPDFGFELANFPQLFLLLDSFVIDPSLNLVTPDLVSLEERRTLSVLVAKVLP